MATTTLPAATDLPLEFRAIHYHAHMSATKARPVARLVRGRPVNEALAILQHTAKRAAPLIRRVLRSAIANAERALTEGHLDFDLNTLVVARCIVDPGPILKRWTPAARGSATPIRRRLCHIKVVLRPPAGAEEA